MKQTEVDQLERLISQVSGLQRELSALSKKSPSDLVNKFKLKHINAILAAANGFLGSGNKAVLDFSQFDEDAPPSNSDVTMVLALYDEALELVRSKNITPKFGINTWSYLLDGGMQGARTAAPRSIAPRKD